VLALAWWAAIIVTLGLAYPWSRASLERFKMRRTSYGELPGRFEASGFSLFLRGLPMWLVVVGPVVVAVAAMVQQVDWDALSDALAQTDSDAVEKLFGDNGVLSDALYLVVGVATLSVLIAILLYPVFQAVLLRWWISGLRFGEVTVTSRLRIRQIYRVYLRFLLYLLAFTLIAGIMGALSAGIILSVVRPAHSANLNAIAAGVLGVMLYVVVMLGTSTIYQVVVAAGLWRVGAQSAELSGTAALDNVRATGATSSALGEGLADALGVGSI